MKKKIALFGLAACLIASMTACGKKDSDKEDKKSEATTENIEKCELEDGIYEADFSTDSSMFHVSEAKDGKGILTVKDGRMEIHIVLSSKNILNLYPGLAEDAKKDGATLLEPSVEEVIYSDGLKEEVYAFDVPVPYLDKEFDLALIGKKGKWYDHKVSVSNPVAYNEGTEVDTEDTATDTDAKVVTEDGEYTIELSLIGGTGKTSVTSPAALKVQNGKMYAIIELSSSKYDYMIVNGVKYLPINTSGNSTFEIEIDNIDNVDVIADTTAMSEPHEIEYVLDFDPASLEKKGTN